MQYLYAKNAIPGFQEEFHAAFCFSFSEIESLNHSALVEFPTFCTVLVAGIFRFLCAAACRFSLAHFDNFDSISKKNLEFESRDKSFDVSYSHFTLVSWRHSVSLRLSDTVR